MSALRAALVTPLGGPLGGYGLAGAGALELWAAAADLGDRWSSVELDTYDTRHDPAAAMRRAEAAAPDVIFGPYGSGAAVAALGATRRPVWNHGGATSRLSRPEFAHVVNVLAPAASYLCGALEAVRAADPGARRVSLLHAPTGFGRDVAGGAAAAARDLGFELYASELVGGRAAEAAAALPPGEVALVAAGFQDEAAAAPVLLAGGWRAVALVGAGVEEVLAELGDRREGLIGPAQWVARAAAPPDEGPDAAWFRDAYRQAHGREPPYPAAQAFAAGVLAARCLRDTGTAEDADQVAAARRLACRTLLGDFRLDPGTGLQVGHRVLTVQWQDGVRRVVWPPERVERALRHPRPGPEIRPAAYGS